MRRVQDEEDRRGVNVSLTANGIREINRAIQRRLDAAARSLAALSEEEQQQLAGLLRSPYPVRRHEVRTDSEVEGINDRFILAFLSASAGYKARADRCLPRSLPTPYSRDRGRPSSRHETRAVPMPRRR